VGKEYRKKEGEERKKKMGRLKIKRICARLKTLHRQESRNDFYT